MATEREPEIRKERAPTSVRSAARLTVEDLAERLRVDPEFGPRCVHWRSLPARDEQVAGFPPALRPELAELYARRGVSSLWSHQREAIEHALAGRDVLVTTPTASGKTLCFVVPVLQRLLESDGKARALFLYPTKALSQDQSTNLNALLAELGSAAAPGASGAAGREWHSYTYDGDTPPSVRRTLRDQGHIVLTNPWMLHAGILPNHAKWAELFRDLETVVIDEVHTLSGVFGSSVANVLRRLQRIAEHYGARPRFLLSSATIPNAKEHARSLIGRDVELVERDGSPSGARTFAVYNPPMLDAVAGLRANALEEARRIALRVVGPKHQTIFFANRRTSVEVLTRYLKESAHELGLERDEIRGYRGGYLPNLRREIEADLRAGKVKVVVTTNALELGIDIGSLDVAVLVGYPGSQASFWQRAGRVGRRARSSFVIQIARSDPIDQYLATHPDWLFSAPRERLGLDPNNLVILSEQVKCAAFELPFSERELEHGAFGGAPHLGGILDYLTEESKLLHRRGDRWYWMADAYPAEDVSLAGGGPDNVLILDVDTKKAVGEIDREGSLTTVHEGAIYQVEGETWIVERFDYENRRAYVKRVETDYFTEAEVDTDVRVLRLDREAQRARAEAPELASASTAAPSGETDDYSVWSGEVHVTTLATSYKKVRYYTRESVGIEKIHLPAEEIDTQAFVLALSLETANSLGLESGDRGSAWAGVGKLLRHVAPLFLRCQPQDLGLSTQVRSPHFGRPAIFLYDRVQGGVGLADVLFESHRELFEAALDVVGRCECERGCPACVGPIAEAGPLGKQSARTILAHLVAGGGARERQMG
ncbi:MAG: DEAD/DEAH box helicase [Planctomycetes bacterium]|nr:DEAD/DEAH box helicase [Planctomycetota bacterium]